MKMEWNLSTMVPKMKIGKSQLTLFFNRCLNEPLMRTSSSLAMWKCDETPEKSDATAVQKIRKCVFVLNLWIADDVDHMLKSPIGCWHAHDFFSSQWKDPFMHRGQCELCHAKHHRQSIFDILFCSWQDIFPNVWWQWNILWFWNSRRPWF